VADERPRIQLEDASGPQPLSDESNYEFLQKVFDAKEKDPLAKKGYDVNAVFQLSPNTYNYAGLYEKDIKEGEVKRQAPEIIEQMEKLMPKMVKRNEGVIMLDAWNMEEGIRTLMHEFRHRAINQDPFLKKIVDDSPFPMELIIRAMDVKYFDDSEGKEWIKDYKLNANGKKYLKEIVDLIETSSKLSEDERNFKKGGIADINYLTRRL
tara:strand:+ start:34 stop:660 length:627 start_codon:yes stop_codon:yes gene_type:complete